MRARIPLEIEKGWSLYVADDAGTLAAMLALHLPDNYLDQLFVAPEYQGQGLGRTLLAFTRQHLPDEIWLRCVRENEKAWRWYEREGFVFEKEAGRADDRLCDEILSVEEGRSRPMMKLYWCPRTRSFSSLWLMEETGQPYERVLVDSPSARRRRRNISPINPMGKVPALQDGDATLAEAAAICAYVAERYPEAKLAPPLGDPLRAKYLYWLFFSPGCIEPAMVQVATKIEMNPVAAGWGEAHGCSTCSTPRWKKVRGFSGSLLGR